LNIFPRPQQSPNIFPSPQQLPQLSLQDKQEIQHKIIINNRLIDEANIVYLIYII